MKTAAFTITALLAGFAASAQVPPQEPRPVFRTGTDLVPLTVTVVDGKGAPVKDLKASDFTVTENKSVREILAFFPQELLPGPIPVNDVSSEREKSAGLRPETRR